MPFYAVKVGRKPGVYKTWDGCKKQVDGFSGAAYKKFDNYPDAYFFANPFTRDSSKLSKDELDALLSAHLLESKDDMVIVDLSPSCKDSINLYTDGACSANPGPGGYGYAVVINDVVSVQGSGNLLYTTNNQMELTAVIEGLKVIPSDYPVIVYSDSSYVVNAFNKKWIYNWQNNNWMKSDGSHVANRELWEELLRIIGSRSDVEFVWVKGHNDNQYNELCDHLAVKALNDIKI